jgi:hypothetical protein
MTRQDAAGILGVPASASRSAARAAMLSRVHQLIAVEGLSTDSEEVTRVELAYSSYCSASSPGKAAGSARTTPPSVQTRSQSSRSWIPIVIVLAILAGLGLLILVATSSSSVNGSTSSKASQAVSGQGDSESFGASAPQSPQAKPLDTGVTGEVGTCWAESPPGSSSFRSTDCDSPSADVRVHKEVRDAKLCPTREYFTASGGWFLCLMNV